MAGMAQIYGSTLLAIVVFAIACGGGTSEPAPEPTATPPPPSAVDDAAYVVIMCAGLDAFSDSTETATTAEELAAVLQEFIDELQAVSPPADVAKFHEAFTNYLIDSLDDPTRPLVTAPPLPDKDVRDRLAQVEHDAPECEKAIFFEREDQ